MSASCNSLFPQSDRAVLRWSENPNLPSREEPVDIVKARPSGALIRSTLQIDKETRVYLIKNGYTRIGIVKSCREDCGVFLMEIASAEAGACYPADPGVLAVDDFITEEEEAQILSGLDAGENESSRSIVTETRKADETLSDLHHLLRGITHSPVEAGRLCWVRPVTVH